MIYLDYLKLPTGDMEFDFFRMQKMTCYDTFYPFQIFPQKELERIDFDNVTILYGGNGSGKSTLLNVLASKLGAAHDAAYNRSNFFEEYVKRCGIEYEDRSFSNVMKLSSDGVFDCMLDIRDFNQAADDERNQVMDEFVRLKDMNAYYPEGLSWEAQKYMDDIRDNPMENIEKLRKKVMANSKSKSKYVRGRAVGNVRERSNGESAFEYFVSKIDKDGIYLLDEPENSLSPARQIELTKFLEDSARYYNCQLVIATHSPFVLSIRGAKIYDLDSRPVDIKGWTELENVRTYFDFFKQHEKEFE